MYCPTCKEKYPDNLTECPKDKTKLVKELPFQAVPSDDGTVWVEIGTASTLEEARLLQGFLEAESIPAQVENVEPSGFPANFGALGDIRVYVPADDETRALQLLKQREQEYEDLDDETETVVTDEGEADIDENEPVEAEKE